MNTPYGQTLDWISQATQKQLGTGQYFNSSRQFGGVPPWIQRPDEWRDFDANDVATVPAVGSTVTVVQYQVPIGEDGVLQGFHIAYTASEFDTGDLVFIIYIDDRPVRNYNNIRMNLGSTQIPRETRIRVLSGNVVKIVCNHVANGTLDGKAITGTLKGYTYSRSET